MGIIAGAAYLATRKPAGGGDGGGGEPLTADQLSRICPRADAQKWHPLIVRALREADATTPARVAMFLAQMAHESGQFKYLEELASGDAYEGRKSLGNTRPGDGPRFKGRGIIQLTGRYNYGAAGDALGIDLLSRPEVAAEPSTAARVAAWYWRTRNCNEGSDRLDLEAVTRRINGGLNGLEDRRRYYETAKRVMGVSV